MVTPNSVMLTFALRLVTLFWKYCSRLLTAQSVDAGLFGFNGAKHTSFRDAFRLRSDDQNSIFYRKKHRTF